MRDGAAGQNGDNGLSEVIGFVLIIGLIVVAASLYLTYGVPAQGRENEILHMNSVNDQFVEYKIGLDSLFNNNKVGTTIGNSFILGTSGGYTQGSMGFLPILSPVNSAGVIAINQRTTDPETLTITSQALILNNSVQNSADLPAVVQNAPAHIYVNISGILPDDLNANTAYGTQVSGSGWIATVNFTPRLTYYTSYTVLPSQSTCPTGMIVSTNQGPPVTYSCLFPTSALFYNWSDIGVTVLKNNVTTLQDVTVYRNISSDATYTVDLMDEAYGIRSILTYPDNYTISDNYYNYDHVHNTQHILGNGNVTYGYSEMTYVMPPLTMGALEYRAQNYYWIPQTYYYQLGGVFLSQLDGNVTYKLPPEITLSYNNASSVPSQKIVTVNINALTFDPTTTGVVGGNTPVQIKTTLNGITNLPFAKGSANAKWIRIGVNTSDSRARVMWANYFNYTATTANIPNVVTGNTTTESYIIINGYDTTNSWPDINVIASNATYSTSVRGIGGMVT